MVVPFLQDSPMGTGYPQELGLNSGDESIEPEAFKALDADGDGVVSKEDLKNKLQQLGFWMILAL